MRATAGGSAFPAYKLLYANEGNTLAGTRALPGSGVVWATDGESIFCTTPSDGQYEALLLFEGGLFGHAFWLEYQVKFYESGDEGYPWAQLGLGIANSSDQYATTESNALDVTVSGADPNFGSYTVWFSNFSRVLSTPEFAPGEWVSVAYEIVGHNIGVWIDSAFIGSFSAVRGGYDSGTGGLYNCVRITSARSRRADHLPPHIKKIRVYQMDLGEFE